MSIRIGIVSHYFFYGSCQALYDFLKNRVDKLVFIEFPLDITKGFLKKPIKVSIPNNIIKNYYFYSKILVLNYLIHFFVCFYLQFYNFKKFDHIISCNPINCFVTIILKKIISLKKISYFSIDYSSERFGKNNYLLNLIYIYLDYFCYRFSDENWDISPTMLNGRLKNFPDMNLSFYKKKLKIIPVGTWNRVIVKRFSKDKLKLIFIGHFIERGGIFKIINYLSYIDKNKYKVTLVGGGDNFSLVNKIILKKKLNNNVKVINWVNNKIMRKYLANADIGLALYEDIEHNYNCNPTKIIEYISNGIPIMTTSVNYLSKHLIKNKCAIQVDSLTDFKNKFDFLNQNRKELDAFSRKAILISKEYSWDSIFAKAMNT
jgi:hypothetical protein